MSEQHDKINFSDTQDKKRENEIYSNLKTLISIKILLKNFPLYYDEENHDTEEEALINDLSDFGTVEQMEIYCQNKGLKYLDPPEIQEAEREAEELYNRENIQGYGELDEAKEN